MRFSILSFILVAVAVPSLGLPLQGELAAREPEPGGPSWYFPPPSKGGNGGNAQSGNSGNANGGSVYQEASPWGYIYNGYGSGKYFTTYIVSSAILTRLTLQLKAAMAAGLALAML